MELIFRVEEQTLVREDSKKVVEDSFNYITIFCTFSEDWADRIKTAVFSNSKGMFSRAFLPERILTEF